MRFRTGFKTFLNLKNNYIFLHFDIQVGLTQFLLFGILRESRKIIAISQQIRPKSNNYGNYDPLCSLRQLNKKKFKGNFFPHTRSAFLVRAMKCGSLLSTRHAHDTIMPSQKKKLSVSPLPAQMVCRVGGFWECVWRGFGSAPGSAQRGRGPG